MSEQIKWPEQRQHAEALRKRLGEIATAEILPPQISEHMADDIARGLLENEREDNDEKRYN